MVEYEQKYTKELMCEYHNSCKDGLRAQNKPAQTDLLPQNHQKICWFEQIPMFAPII